MVEYEPDIYYVEVIMGSRAMKGRPGTTISQKKTGFLMVITIIVAVIAALGFGAISVMNTWLEDLPDYADADAYNASLPTVVYASDGTTVLAEFQLEFREPVAIDQISDYVLKGTVATEDERFYSHGGVDLWGIGRALVNNLMGGQLEGASTITQQFVRNTILSDEMNDITLARKVREAYISMKLEEKYTKDEILLMYLNTINYGSGAYGIEAASQRYFSKSAKDLTLVEAATLIGIPQSPTYNNPIDNIDQCTKRRNVVLDRMVSNNVITREEADAAKQEPIVLNVHEQSQNGILAYDYFTAYVRDQLTSASGKYAYSRDEIFKGGLSVYTTLDVDVQKAAEAAAKEKEDDIGEPFEVSMVAIDPDNGFIRAMVGGKDFQETQVNMATGTGGTGRQAGSSFKTFTLAAAIEEGIDPNLLVDAGREVEFPGWMLHNYGNIDYGTRTIASAFHMSSITAIARLCMAIHPMKVADMAYRLGIESTLTETGSITLGTSSVTPLEMADAYATLANGGIHYDAECIERIVDSKGNTIVDNNDPEGERVVSPEVAAATVEVMEGVITAGDGTGRAARLKSGQVAAGKTGTTDEYADVWFCGITPQYSVAIWMGDRSDYVDAERMPDGWKVADVFANFLNQVLDPNNLEQFPTADKPQYDKNYYNSEYHIGGYFGSKSGNEVDNEEEPEEEDPTEPTEPTEPTDPTEPNGGANGGPQEPVPVDPQPTEPDPPAQPDPPTEPDPPVDPDPPAQPDPPVEPDPGPPSGGGEGQ